MLQGNDAAFSAPADRSRDVKGRRLGGSSRDDEAAQRLEFRFALIDGRFEFPDACFIDPRLLE